MPKYRVELTYFKKSGKFYSHGEYETEKQYMFQVFDEVRDMIMQGRMPGLIGGLGDFTILVTSPTHPNGYPGLIHAS